MEAKNHRMLEKALLMLEYISGQPQGVSLPDICEYLHLAKSSAYSLLITFVNMGYVKRDSRGRFIIGMKPFEIGSRFVENSDFFLYARDVLKDLADAVDETAHLAALEGADVVYLSKFERSYMVPMASSVGKRLPAYATALGKALLSGKTDAQVRALLRQAGMKPVTAHTLSDPDALLIQLEEVRRTGFAYEREESSLGVQCMAVPVLEHLGSVYLGLSLSVPAARTGPELERMKPFLLEAKRRLERVL